MNKLHSFYRRINIVGAAEKNNFEAIKYLINYGINPNSIYDFGETALYWACHNGNKEIIDFLLEHKANPNISKYNQPSPLCEAIK